MDRVFIVKQHFDEEIAPYRITGSSRVVTITLTLPQNDRE